MDTGTGGPSLAAAPAVSAAPSSGGSSKWPLVLLFALVLGIAGLVGYIIYSFLQYKKETDAALKKERELSLANAKYIVDQANHINTVFNSNIAAAQNTADYARAGLSNWGGYFDQVVRFGGGGNTGSGSGSGSGSASATQLKLGQMANAAVTDMSLIKHTSFVSGLTAKDLTSASSAAFCGEGPNARCIRFPNAQGDTYLTSLAAGKSVVVDAPAVFNDRIAFSSNAGIGVMKMDGVNTLALKTADHPVNGTLALSKDGLMAVAGNQMYVMSDGSHVFGAMDDDGNGTNLVVARNGVQMSGDVYFVANQTPYAKIGFSAAQKSIEIKPLGADGTAVATGGKVIVHGDVVLADANTQYGVVGRDTDASGRPTGLKISGVLNNRLVLDSDVYVPTGRTLYGATAAAAAPATGPVTVQPIAPPTTATTATTATATTATASQPA